MNKSSECFKEGFIYFTDETYHQVCILNEIEKSNSQI